MSRGERVPVRLCSLDDAMEAARGRGLAVVIDGDGGFSLAFTTTFGPCLRRHGMGEEGAFLLRVLSESSVADYAAVAIAGAAGPVADRILRDPRLGAVGAPAPGPPQDAAEALSAFGRRRAGIPVHSGAGAAARARSSTIAPCPGVAYERGETLRPAIEPQGDRTVIRWRRPDGGDAGIHLVLDRPPTDAEARVVAGADGTVVSVVPGTMPWRDGTRRVQTLVLDVPHGFAEAFPDGRMPRHGLAGAA